MKYILIITFLLISLSSFSQYQINGTVRNVDNNQSIEGVVISVIDKDKDIIAYDISNNNGKFDITFNGDISSLTLTASLLGFETKSITIQDKKEQTIDIKLTPKEIVLKEVSVKSDMIWRHDDTLVYSVVAFKDKQDRTIGDILKKLPGVQVSSSGSIKYNGEPINKLYIEGLDLLEQKYGIATNNIPVDAVTNVEVIEDHQPIKSLKNVISSGQAAINLKLKDNKMVRPVGNTTLGGGKDERDFLWLLSAFAMQAEKRRQTIVMYKSNNAGIDIASELTEHSLDLSNPNRINYPRIKTLFGSESMRNMSIDQKRYLFNKTHILSVNNLWKVNDDNVFRMNVNYMNDARKQRTSQYSSYYINDTSLVINELNHLEKRYNLLDGALTYTSNSDKFYLNNKLKSKFQWDKTVSDISNQNQIIQNYSTPVYQISNDLQLVKKQGSRVWDITSFIHYSSQPQKVCVNIDTLNSELKQTIHYTNFYTNNSTYLSFLKGYSSLLIQLNAETSLEGLHSNLKHNILTDSLRNDLKTDFFTFSFNPIYTFRKEKFQFTANLLLKQNLLKVKDYQYNNQNTYSYFFALPKLNISYKFNPFLNGALTYRYNKDIGDIFNFGSSPIMHNYRNIQIKSGILSKRKTHTASLQLNYRNPITTFFSNTGLIYMSSKNNLLNEQRFLGIQSVSSNFKQNNSSDTWMWNGYIGKYMSEIKTNFSVLSSYTITKSEKIQQNVLYPIQYNVWNITPKISAKLSENMNFTYQFDFNTYKTKIKSASKTSNSSTSQISQLLKYFYFIKKFELKIQGEHLYNEISENISTKTYFVDLGIRYTTKNLEFTLDWNNIFNKKEYTYTVYNDLDTFIYSYSLRPANILANVSFKY